jgi:hypothetical protein
MLIISLPEFVHIFVMAIRTSLSQQIPGQLFFIPTLKETLTTLNMVYFVVQFYSKYEFALAGF